MAAALDEMPLCEPVVHFLPVRCRRSWRRGCFPERRAQIAEAKTPIPPAVTAKRTVVPKRFFSPPLDAKCAGLELCAAAAALTLAAGSSRCNAPRPQSPCPG